MTPEQKHPARGHQQTITWYTPQEKLPKPGRRVLIMFSKPPRMRGYKSYLAVGKYFPVEKNWQIEGISPWLYSPEMEEIRAWADVEADIQAADMDAEDMND